MKVVHKSISPKDLPKTFSFCLQYAQEQENQENIIEAIAAYEKCIQLNPNQELPYNRLMILYRKQKEPLKELKVIQQAINSIEAFTKPKKSSKTITRLSNALLKATGMVDKKGKPLNELQPILKWRKREILLKNRLKKNNHHA